MAKPMDIVKPPVFQPTQRFSWVRSYYAIVPDESANYGISFERFLGGKGGKLIRKR